VTAESAWTKSDAWTTFAAGLYVASLEVISFACHSISPVHNIHSLKYELEKFKLLTPVESRFEPIAEERAMNVILSNDLDEICEQEESAICQVSETKKDVDKIRSELASVGKLIATCVNQFIFH
jgi:hypothetical protein